MKLNLNAILDKILPIWLMALVHRLVIIAACFFVLRVIILGREEEIGIEKIYWMIVFWMLLWMEQWMRGLVEYENRKKDVDRGIGEKVT